MRIVINGRNLNNLITGIGVYTQELAINLAKQKDVEVTLITNNSKIILSKVRVISDFWQFLGPIYDIFIFGLRGLGAEVTFSPANAGSLFSLAKIKATTIHDLSTFDRPRDYPMINKLVIKFSIRIAYWFSNVIFTDSNFSQKRIKNILGRKRNLWVIPLGVNRKELTKFSHVMKRSKRNLITIVTNATHSHRKNIYGLVQAIKESRNSEMIRLIITGVKFKDITDSNVFQTGYLSRAKYLTTLSRADIFVYPSFYEGFGLPVIEASQLGINLLTSNKTSLVELVHDQKITFDPTSVASMAKKIDWLIGLDNRYQVALVSRQKEYIKRFSWEKTSRRFLQKLSESYE